MLTCPNCGTKIGYRLLGSPIQITSCETCGLAYLLHPINTAVRSAVIHGVPMVLFACLAVPALIATSDRPHIWLPCLFGGIVGAVLGALWLDKLTRARFFRATPIALNATEPEHCAECGEHIKLTDQKQVAGVTVHSQCALEFSSRMNQAIHSQQNLCPICQSEPAPDAIEFGAIRVCPQCKDAYAQRLKEGLN